jgi:HTH-type transcriptional regulator, sugar sensing transcriptional regulator
MCFGKQNNLNSSSPPGGNNSKYMLKEDLNRLGLSDGEARVFLSLLKLGLVKVGAIVKDSAISYSKVYDVLHRLSMKGLVSQIIVENVKHFNAVEPYRLHEYLQSKEEELNTQKEVIDRIVPQLAEFARGNRNKKNNSAEVFVGDKGLRTAYEILLSNSFRKKNDILRYFYPHAGYHDVATPFYSRLYQFQKSKKIEQRGIATIAFRNSKHFKEIPKDVIMRFVNFPLPGTMDIFRDKLLIISWNNTVTGILIVSEEIAEHFKSYFDKIWEIAS